MVKLVMAYDQHRSWSFMPTSTRLVFVVTPKNPGPIIFPDALVFRDIWKQVAHGELALKSITPGSARLSLPRTCTRRERNDFLFVLEGLVQEKKIVGSAVQYKKSY